MSRSINEPLNSANSKQKELFFATLAHDLKNPVQAQLLSLKMLADGSFGKLNKSQTEMLNILLESSNYMHNMLQSILNSYKYDNGVMFLVKEKLSVKELLRNCINEVKSFAHSKNIKIVFKAQTKSDEILADIIQLRRVISNLLNNALNYSYHDSDLIISILNDNDNVIFSFKNTSPEIPEDIKEHIFEKYVSGTQTGLGLGLYFSKKVIEAHCGDIFLEANGTSNEFIFKIPVYNPTHASITC
jgi:signal transduction histidine kinase